MIKLTCLVVGERNTFTINNVDEEQEVETLAIAIQDTIKYSGASKDLLLFKAVKFDEAKGGIKENSDFIPADCKDLITLSQSEEYVNDETFMIACTRVCRFFDGKNLPNEDFIHVLVQLPEPERQVKQQIGRPSQHIAVQPTITLTDQTMEINGLSLNEKYLNRDELVDNLLRLLKDSRFAVVSSPPATGKTSLIQLARRKYDHQFNFIVIKCVADKDPFKVLDLIGIDFEKETTALGAQCIVVLDDAQNYYNNKSFWTHLIKNSFDWLPARFIIVATHDLTKFNRAPVELKSLPHLQKENLLVSHKEGIQLINLYTSSKNICSKILHFAILRECCGVIGAIKLSVCAINRRFMHYDTPSESEILQFLFSHEFTGHLTRVFSTDLGEIQPVFRNFLKIMFVCNFSIQTELDHESMNTLFDLEEGGVLVHIGSGCYCFSSPLAKRFYFKQVFPNRSRIIPDNIVSLIQSAITNMSSTNLKNSTIDSKDFPREAVFQHEFMTGLTIASNPSCFICPELSQVFPELNENCEMVQENMKIDGEIDFYIDGSLRWGIELVVNGDKISGNTSCFSKTGKYYPLRVFDYAIVDFRRSADGRPANITATEKRISIFFPVGEFDKCVCRLGNIDVELQLSS